LSCGLKGHVYRYYKSYPLLPGGRPLRKMTGIL
jgi:hypothetical protein